MHYDTPYEIIMLIYILENVYIVMYYILYIMLVSIINNLNLLIINLQK